METQLQYQIQNLKTINPTSISGLITRHQPGADDLRHAPRRHQLDRLHRQRRQHQLQPPLPREPEGQWQAASATPTSTLLRQLARRDQLLLARRRARADRHLRRSTRTTPPSKRSFSQPTARRPARFSNSRSSTSSSPSSTPSSPPSSRTSPPLGRVVTDWTSPPPPASRRWPASAGAAASQNYTYRGPPAHTLNRLP